MTMNIANYLLLLQAIGSYGIIYYDDDEMPEKQVDLTENIEIDIDPEDVAFQLLIAGGYKPESNNIFSKYMASIRTNDPTEFFGDNHYCSGTLVGLKMIITAGHCILNAHKLRTRPQRMKVILGTPNRLRKTQHTIQSGVKELFLHPEYRRDHHHDIAILILDTDVPFSNPMIEIAYLPRERPKIGTKCTVLGWGHVIMNGAYAAGLVYLDLEILNDSECESWNPEYDRKTELCADDTFDPLKGVSRGDSGSPLICDNRLAGIVSRGLACDQNNSTAIFTDIYAHREWIFTIQNSQASIALSVLLLIDCLLITLIFFLV